MYGATHVGRDHVRVGRNNQDGVFVSRDVVVVTDGCGSQPHSEVGAQLGARFLGEWLQKAVVDSTLPVRAVDAVTHWLSLMTTWPPLPDGERVGVRGQLLETHFLFTFLAAVRSGDEVLVFGMGDGRVLVDNRSLVLDAGDDNAPDYCAYRVFSSSPSSPVTHFHGAASRVALMTDGLSSLPSDAVNELCSEGLHRNPLTLQRRLNVLASRERLHDDATIAVLGGT